ncbi:DinB family protein [Cohnella nanjingensis]|uniref:DinB family protein n=1 Tax=Cohnella nanjingensis TaxID=1387779 RepID=A0A7X0RW88_9BACL|nr:DinB family protein [Cohnella nanjingensis]MBB6674803.1 DinB family protein [Cohnella nanjingensis]
MSRLELLKQYWDFTYDQEDWFPPLKDALNGVTAAQADWRPEGEAANTIRATVHHLVFYKERFLQALQTGDAGYPPGLTNDDTFRADGTDEASWTAVRARLEAAHRSLRALLGAMTESDLEKRVPKTETGQWFMSLIAHDAYHTGEIVQIRKLQGSWPARRSFE